MKDYTTPDTAADTVVTDEIATVASTPAIPGRLSSAERAEIVAAAEKLLAEGDLWSAALTFETAGDLARAQETWTAHAEATLAAGHTYEAALFHRAARNEERAMLLFALAAGELEAAGDDLTAAQAYEAIGDFDRARALRRTVVRDTTAEAIRLVRVDDFAGALRQVKLMSVAQELLDDAA